MVTSYLCVLSFVPGTIEEVKKYLLTKHELSTYHVEGERSEKVHNSVSQSWLVVFC